MNSLQPFDIVKIIEDREPLQLFDIVRIIEDRDETDWLVIGIILQENYKYRESEKSLEFLDRNKEMRLVVKLSSLKENKVINKYLHAVRKVTEGLEVALSHEDENIRKSCKLWLETAKQKDVGK
jgi:hypothetical protein